MSRQDPLHVLRTDDLPVQPDPAFAAQLRRRLQTALALPEGITMSGSAAAVAELTEPRPAALPYLSVADARAAIAWYTEAFGAAVIGEPIVMPDGRIGHAELEIGRGVLYLADEFPEMGLKAPAPEAVSVSLMLHVASTDATLRQARAHGAEVVREIYENHGSRNATIIDPFGHRWMLSGPLATPIRPGDIGYISVRVPDADRAATFYRKVLGWSYDPASQQVTNTDLPTGIFAGPGTPTLFCCYAVADLAAARAAIAEAGGSTGEVRQTEHGAVLDATDSQGMAFAVFAATPGVKRPELNGSGPGEVSYVTYEVADSAAFRDFYGRVLGWTFEPGRIDDGWAVRDAHPMSGAAGGSRRPAVVPMWTVADIDAAVAKVREAGGTVLAEPSRQPYGLSAECTDDQGSRFYLGQS
ncbi:MULTISPECIES: VOC family protein [Mycobacterium]|uniref:Glyoxalase n=1 Tax=Mycobacterium kiyosense TaxID=2871094 RepID=A0A9P3QA47_9MYCO|nr:MULTISPECIES: VOC family protein [Mycobacterium]BDB40563.1 glyoxalase [Mycobacterium kiyosense]BDE12379.1 glyoxalase [Mycobacterium sp. 20KCMC460]GLB85555.1 glyoxalase [Mycobacterium kiyosense]GLB88616.1 glyoxalase [Mycobacterium kiyosense]GLB98894.1 glyoxalase [Mycobacterium kiyosense]